MKLARIHQDIDTESGKTSNFDVTKLSEKIARLKDADALFVFEMFLPCFSMLTPLHVLAVQKQVDLFNSIANRIDDIMFAAFMKRGDLLAKIRDMFIFTLEHVYSYEANAIEKFYCQLDLDLDEEEEDSEENQCDLEIAMVTRLNCGKIQNYLCIIKEYVLKEPDFSKHRHLLI